MGQQHSAPEAPSPPPPQQASSSRPQSRRDSLLNFSSLRPSSSSSVNRRHSLPASSSASTALGGGGAGGDDTTGTGGRKKRKLLGTLSRTVKRQRMKVGREAEEGGAEVGDVEPEPEQQQQQQQHEEDYEREMQDQEDLEHSGRPIVHEPSSSSDHLSPSPSLASSTILSSIPEEGPSSSRPTPPQLPALHLPTSALSISPPWRSLPAPTELTSIPEHPAPIPIPPPPPMNPNDPLWPDRARAHDLISSVLRERGRAAEALAGAQAELARAVAASAAHAAANPHLHPNNASTATTPATPGGASPSSPASPAPLTPAPATPTSTTATPPPILPPIPAGTTMIVQGLVQTSAHARPRGATSSNASTTTANAAAAAATAATNGVRSPATTEVRTGAGAAATSEGGTATGSGAGTGGTGGTTNERPRAPSPSPSLEEQATMLSTLLSVATAATAASLVSGASNSPLASPVATNPNSTSTSNATSPTTLRRISDSEAELDAALSPALEALRRATANTSGSGSSLFAPQSSNASGGAGGQGQSPAMLRTMLDALRERLRPHGVTTQERGAPPSYSSSPSTTNNNNSTSTSALFPPLPPPLPSSSLFPNPNSASSAHLAPAPPSTSPSAPSATPSAPTSTSTYTPQQRADDLARIRALQSDAARLREDIAAELTRRLLAAAAGAGGTGPGGSGLGTGARVGGSGESGARAREILMDALSNAARTPGAGGAGSAAAPTEPPAEGTFERFLWELQVDLRALLTRGEVRRRDVPPPAEGQPPDLNQGHTTQGGGNADGERLNWWRMYRFPARTSTAGETPAEGADETVIPVILVGLRSVLPRDPPPTLMDMAHGSPPLLPAANTEGGSGSVGSNGRSSPATSASMPALSPMSSRSGDGDSATTASASASASGSGSGSGGTWSRATRLLRPSTWGTREQRDRERERERERDRDRVRESVRHPERTGPAAPEPESAAGAAGTRSYIIWVVGGHYPPNHPILTAPHLLTGQLDHDDLWALGELLGQVKPPTASAADIARSGLEVFRGKEMLEAYEKEGKVAANCTDRCLICLGDYEEDEDLRILGCRHTFHKECVDRWLEQGKNNCPACRSKGVSTQSETPADAAPIAAAAAPAEVPANGPGPSESASSPPAPAA